MCGNFIESTGPVTDIENQIMGKNMSLYKEINLYQRVMSERGKSNSEKNITNNLRLYPLIAR